MYYGIEYITSIISNIISSNLKRSLSFLYLDQINAFGSPHCCSANAKENSSQDYGVNVWMNLYRYINRVTEHTENHRPFNCQDFNKKAGKKNKRDH